MITQLSKLFLLFLLVVSSKNSKIFAQKKDKVLKIEPIMQLTSHWCWATSIQMALKHENIILDQCQIINIYNGKDCDCSKNVTCLSNKLCFRNYDSTLCAKRLPKLKNSAHKEDQINLQIYNLQIIDSILVKSGINKNMQTTVIDSVIWAIRNKKSVIAFDANDSNHIVLVKGFDLKNNKILLYLNDPAPFKKFRKSGNYFYKSASTIIDYGNNGKNLLLQYYPNMTKEYNLSRFLIVNI